MEVRFSSAALTQLTMLEKFLTSLLHAKLTGNSPSMGKITFIGQSIVFIFIFFVDSVGIAGFDQYPLCNGGCEMVRISECHLLAYYKRIYRTQAKIRDN